MSEGASIQAMCHFQVKRKVIEALVCRVLEEFSVQILCGPREKPQDEALVRKVAVLGVSICCIFVEVSPRCCGPGATGKKRFLNF